MERIINMREIPIEKEEELRTKKYKKNSILEEHLRNINTILAPLESQLVKDFVAPRLPIVFIVGAPRSFTTLVEQLLAASNGFSYISNFVARFWLAPYFGALTELALNIRGERYVHTYESTFGVTRGWSGPHEFGYFWGRWFRFGNTHKIEPEELAKVDIAGMRRELSAIEAAYNKPLFFKSLICGLQIKFFAELFDKSIFVVCRRTPIYNAQSLLLARDELLGDRQLWCSLRPKEYPKLLALSCYEQVVAQSYYILKDIDESLSTIDSARRVDLDYMLLCENPRREIQKIIDTVEALGSPVEWIKENIPATFTPDDFQQVDDKTFKRLQDACDKYFGRGI